MYIDNEEKETKSPMSDNKKLERFALGLTAGTCIIALLVFIANVYMSYNYNDKLDERHKNLTRDQLSANKQMADINKEIADANKEIANLQLEINKFQLFKDFSTLLADNPNTIAVYLVLEIAKDTSSDESFNKSLGEILKKVDSFAESQIKRHIIDLFNNSPDLQADSIAKVLDNLSSRNLESFLYISQNEIDFRSKNYSDNYKLKDGVVNILHILSCQSESDIREKAVNVNGFLIFLKNGKYDSYSPRYEQLSKIVIDEMSKSV